MQRYLRITRDGHALALVKLRSLTKTGTQRTFTIELSELQAAIGPDRLDLKNVSLVTELTHITKSHG